MTMKRCSMTSGEKLQRSEVERLNAIADDIERALTELRYRGRNFAGQTLVLKTSPSITRRSLARNIYELARKFEGFQYAILGDGDVRIVTVDQKRFRVTVTEE